MGQVLKGLVRWQGAVQFSGESGRGHHVTMDGPESSGGQDAGFRPMELILLGVGGCTSFDVVKSFAKRNRQSMPVGWSSKPNDARKCLKLFTVFT